MREHLFKAKRIDNGEWVEGLLIYGNYIRMFINTKWFDDEFKIERIHTKTKDIQVDPETVCEYAGLLDKNGKKIFEGDIVKYEVDRNFYKKAEIVFKNCQFLCIDLSNKMVTQPAYMNYELEVIGNKFDLEVSDVKD